MSQGLPEAVIGAALVLYMLNCCHDSTYAFGDHFEAFKVPTICILLVVFRLNLRSRFSGGRLTETDILLGHLHITALEFMTEIARWRRAITQICWE